MVSHFEVESLTGSSEEVVRSQDAFEQMVKERLQYAVRVALISVLEEEVTAFIGARPYERSAQRRDQRNGHYTRNARNNSGSDDGSACSAHTTRLPNAAV